MLFTLCCISVLLIFLHFKNTIKGLLFQTDNIFRRALQYSISLGGDTDTIASMAGALVGAHLGHEVIPPNLIRHCENSETIISLANDILDASKNVT